MTVDLFEDRLRAALAGCADDVPSRVVERLRQHAYHPRTPRRHRAAGVATMAVAFAAGAAGFVIGTRTPAPPAQPGAQTIRLADATISLPAGFVRTDTACVATPAGLHLVGSSFAAAVSPGGGCITLLLATRTSAPSGGESVVISGYPGSVVVDRSSGVSTAYITIPSDLYIDGSREVVIENPNTVLDLVIASRGLSPDQVAAIAAAGIPDHPVSDG
jgi:hypothetical protein